MLFVDVEVGPAFIDKVLDLLDVSFNRAAVGGVVEQGGFCLIRQAYTKLIVIIPLSFTTIFDFNL